MLHSVDQISVETTVETLILIKGVERKLKFS